MIFCACLASNFLPLKSSTMNITNDLASSTLIWPRHLVCGLCFFPRALVPSRNRPLLRGKRMFLRYTNVARTCAVWCLNVQSLQASGVTLPAELSCQSYFSRVLRAMLRYSKICVTVLVWWEGANVLIRWKLSFGTACHQLCFCVIICVSSDWWHFGYLRCVLATRSLAASIPKVGLLLSAVSQYTSAWLNLSSTENKVW